MRALRELLHRLVGTLRPGRGDDDLEDELRSHIELAAEAAERRGASPEEAQRRVRVRYGGTTQAVDRLRAQRGLPWLADLGRDIRYACRVLARNRGFTAAAVLSLGLGIGANTAIFSLIDAVLMRPLSVEDPGTLYFLAHGEGDAPPADSNYPLLERYWSVSAFSGVTAYQTATFRVAAGNSLELVPGQFVSGNYHAVVGVQMRLGRGFATEPDASRSDDGLAVISEGYWTRRFGRSPNVVGQSLTVDGRPVTIVGVTAAPFAGFVPGTPVDITVPLSTRIRQTPAFLTALDGFTQMPIVARLQGRTSEAQALAAADAVFQQFMEMPDVRWARTGMPAIYSRARLLPAGHGQDGLQRMYREPLLALMGMAALVLLVACANVANLLLARSSARAKEMALRLSVGSGRGRLIRQLLTESAVLALAGGALGLLVAYWGTHAAVSLLSTWRDTIVLDVAPDSRALAFTTLVALATGTIFGVVPALKATRVDLLPALKGHPPGASGVTRGSLFGRSLVVAQVALCVVVVAVAALLGQSVYALRAKDSGFDPARVLLVNVDASSSSLVADRLDALYAELVGAVRGMPGVTAAAASTMTPLGMQISLRGLNLPGLPATAEARGVFSNAVTDDFFSAFGIQIRRGRGIDRRDASGSRRVAVINERTARYVFGDDDPIGRTIAWNAGASLEVVGVTEDSNQENLRDGAPRMVYTSLAQEGTAPRRLQLAAKTTGDPAAMAPSIREVVRNIGPDLVVTEVRTMADQVDGTIVRERSLSWIAIAFAALATVLACVGLYGVMSYQVARRTSEIGIRLALGASERSIFGGIIGQTLALALTGIAIGIAGALISTQAIAAFLYGVTPRDPLTLACAGLALAATALAAGYLPARRAARINPLRAIRTE